MGKMFDDCLALNEIDISNFKTTNIISMELMFFGCSDELKNKVKEQNKNIKSEAFYEGY